MNEYELFNEKTAEVTGPYLSDKMLEKGDIITFQAENFVVLNILIPQDRKLRVAIWPAKINLRKDIEDLRLLHWIQQNLIGMKIRISNDNDSIEGKVIDYWPGIRFLLPDNLKPFEIQETSYAKETPGRLEFLLVEEPDNPSMVDLLNYSEIEILII